MSDKDKVVKLNALMKKNNGKLDYNCLKLLKVKGGNSGNGVIKPTNPSEVAKGLKSKPEPAKMNLKMVQNEAGFSKAQILAKKDDSKQKKIYTNEPDV